MIHNVLIILLFIILFLQNPIRFSGKKIIYKLNYNLLTKYLLYIIIAIELYQLHLSNLKIYSNYLVILPAIICYIIIDIIHREPIIDDGSCTGPYLCDDGNTLVCDLDDCPTGGGDGEITDGCG